MKMNLFVAYKKNQQNGKKNAFYMQQIFSADGLSHALYNCSLDRLRNCRK